MSILIQPIHAPSLVTEGTRIQGDISFECGTQLFGVVEGSIRHNTTEPLQIGETGWVSGKIRSKGPVIIEGRVEGMVSSKTRICLTRSANVKGSLFAPGIEILPGALFEGEVTMSKKPASAEAQKPAA